MRWFQQSRDCRKWKLWCLSGERSPYTSFSARPTTGLAECSLLATNTTDLKFKMLLTISVTNCSVVFGIMGAAKVGCRSSCKRSKSQADNGELPEQNLEHEVIWVLCRKIIWQVWQIIIWILLLQKPEDLRSSSQSNCQERSPLLLFLGRSGRWEFSSVSCGNILQTDLFLLGVQFFVGCIFVEKRWGDPV